VDAVNAGDPRAPAILDRSTGISLAAARVFRFAAIVKGRRPMRTRAIPSVYLPRFVLAGRGAAPAITRRLEVAQ